MKTALHSPPETPASAPLCPGLYLADHGLGQDLGPLGSADDVGGLEEDLGTVLDRLQVPLPPRSHRRQDGSVEQVLWVETRTDQ